jgi:hypothetical protein
LRAAGGYRAQRKFVETQPDHHKIKARPCVSFALFSASKVRHFERSLAWRRSSTLPRAQRKCVETHFDQRRFQGHPCGEFQPLGGRTARLLRPLLSDQRSKICRRHPRGEFLPLGARIAPYNEYISSTGMRECTCISMHPVSLSPLLSLSFLSLSLSRFSLSLSLYIYIYIYIYVYIHIHILYNYPLCLFVSLFLFIYIYVFPLHTSMSLV